MNDRSADIVVEDLDVLARGGWNFDTSQVTFDSTIFDPFPAYAHDRRLVKKVVDDVRFTCPPIYPITIYNADREAVARVNAYARGKEGAYVNGEWDRTPRGTIMLMGKRIPPHPGMTRHLVGHEYGHHVNYMLNVVRDVGNMHDWGVLKEYAEVRGYDPELAKHSGSGGNWATSIQEIFATDFRYLVCGIERNYWPHPGVPEPAGIHGLWTWWDAALESLRSYTPPVAEEEAA